MLSCIKYTLLHAGIQLKIVMVIASDCIGSCNYNCHIMVTWWPYQSYVRQVFCSLLMIETFSMKKSYLLTSFSHHSVSIVWHLTTFDIFILFWRIIAPFCTKHGWSSSRIVFGDFPRHTRRPPCMNSCHGHIGDVHVTFFYVSLACNVCTGQFSFRTIRKK
jgi:hypothetical protein